MFDWLKIIKILIFHREKFKDFIADIMSYKHEISKWKAKIKQTKRNMIALYEEMKKEYNE